MTDQITQEVARSRCSITVRGVVQGVGFRPFVYKAARALGLTGWVKNDGPTVQIEAHGLARTLEEFVGVLKRRHPPQARIDQIEVSYEPWCEDEPRDFRIRNSTQRGSPRPAVPADMATCAECREEIRSPDQRRYRYPFTNCTNCGPRWSIIDELPYDRPRTAMAGFAMCSACQSQYADPADRRFHAQPIACPECGPQLELLDAAGARVAQREDALRSAAEAIIAGRIVALKGLGGFQLLCDATSPDAVADLRARKQRRDKPFAVMLATIDEVRTRCELSADEAAVLESPQAPILLLRRLGAMPTSSWACPGPDAHGHEDVATPPTPVADGDIAKAVAPGNPYLGVMLPYSPLHHLLMAAVGRPVVCTSGNLSEEPMAVSTEEARERLAGIADLFLVHDRPIVRPVDDSVARFTSDGLQILRRARGYAPLPIELGISGPVVLAVGGHLKNAVALSVGSQVVLSPHVGDLDNPLGVEVHQRAIADLVRFFHVVPQVVACDLHPDYASTRHAETLAAKWGVPLVRVQHHEAHLAAVIAENRVEGPVLGLSWDGTGFGPDGTVWGGEILEYDGTAFRRFAHLRQFALPGGDRAVREPRRSALGLVFEFLGPEAEVYAAPWFRSEELRVLLQSLARPRLNPRTSSMGRLFDAVAAVCGLPPGRWDRRLAGHDQDQWDRRLAGRGAPLAADGRDARPTEVNFEGQAAMALEFAADGQCEEAYPLPLVDRGFRSSDRELGIRDLRSPISNPQSLIPNPQSPSTGDWEPMIRAILADLAAGESVARVSARFHNALADWAVAAARRWGGRQVALSGGCFQNALLLERTSTRLRAAGFRVFAHQQVPPGDGGIALGQVYYVFRNPR